MLKIIGAVFRYSCLVLVILVLSHIVEVKGVTISQHVENAMNWMGDFSPRKITRSIFSSVGRQIQKVEKLGGSNEGRSNEPEQSVRSYIPRIDSEVSISDEKQLHKIIKGR